MYCCAFNSQAQTDIAKSLSIKPGHLSEAELPNKIQSKQSNVDNFRSTYLKENYHESG
jgi:hypothetical protein